MTDTTLSTQTADRQSQSTVIQPPIGIDIGGTKINAGLVTLDESSHDKMVRSLLNAPTPATSDAFLQTLIDMITQLRNLHPTVSAIGIATAGVVDSLHGKILGSTGNLPALKNLSNLKEQLQAHIQLPIHIENDANAAAYGEWCMGAGVSAREKGAQNMFAVTLGTGVGMGLVLNGQLYRGSHFFAGEGGHIAIAHTHERKCTCGRWDCWEAFASGTGLKITAEKALDAANESARQEFMQKYANQDQPLTYSVIAAWKDGNHLGIDILDSWHHHIAVGISSLVNVLDPDMVVVGGGLAQFVNFDLLTERVRERTMSDQCKLVPAVLGNYAGIVGAGHLALEALR